MYYFNHRVRKVPITSPDFILAQYFEIMTKRKRNFHSTDCLGFICNFRGLGSGARGTICSCLLHHYYGAKLRKRMNETNILQFIQALYYMVYFEAKCFVYYIFCLLSWQFQKLLTSMSIPALTKLSDPLLKLQPPHHTHPVWSTPT